MLFSSKHFLNVLKPKMQIRLTKNAMYNVFLATLATIRHTCQKFHQKNSIIISSKLLVDYNGYITQPFICIILSAFTDLVFHLEYPQSDQDLHSPIPAPR